MATAILETEIDALEDANAATIEAFRMMEDCLFSIAWNSISCYVNMDDVTDEELADMTLPSFIDDRSLQQTIMGTLHSGNLPGIDRDEVDWEALTQAFREIEAAGGLRRDPAEMAAAAEAHQLERKAIIEFSQEFA